MSPPSQPAIGLVWADLVAGYQGVWSDGVQAATTLTMFAGQKEVNLYTKAWLLRGVVIAGLNVLQLIEDSDEH